MLTKYKNSDLVEISEDNVAKVIAMILTDSNYCKSFDVNAKPIENQKGETIYGGSTAYWMTQLKNKLNNNDDDEQLPEEIIQNAVESVDRENSTHLNSDNVGREELTRRILDELPTVKKFKEALIDCSLFNILSAETHPKNEKNEKKYKARKNISFASKFCHYACFYLFDDENKDKYSIYDGVMKKYIPRYLDYFKIQEPYKLEDYREYCKAIDEIICSSKVQISRNGFDLLLWYYYKGKDL